MKPTFDAKALERLHNSKDFLAFLNEVRACREFYIGELVKPEQPIIMHAAGRIAAFDEILVLGKHEQLVDSWSRITTE